MNRYFLSFFLTVFIYVSLVVGYLNLHQNIKVLHSPSKQSNQRVKFTIIAQKPIPKKKIEHKKKREPKKLKKKHKKIIKKIKKIKKYKKIRKIKPKIKPEQKIKQKAKPKPKPVKKPKNIVKKIIPKTQYKQNISKVKKTIIDNQAIKKREILKNQYYLKIKKTIAQNKSYPRKAIRRGIEGIVEVSFIISPKGELLSYKIVSGKKVFHKSAIKALKTSFPIAPPPNIITKNTELSIKLKYVLY